MNKKEKIDKIINDSLSEYMSNLQQKLIEELNDNFNLVKYDHIPGFEILCKLTFDDGTPVQYPMISVIVNQFPGLIIE